MFPHLICPYFLDANGLCILTLRITLVLLERHYYLVKHVDEQYNFVNDERAPPYVASYIQYTFNFNQSLSRCLDHTYSQFLTSTTSALLSLEPPQDR